MFEEILDRLHKIDRLIRSEKTGKPDELAKQMKISVRSLYLYLSIMKNLGAPIYFDNDKTSYCYKETGRLAIGFIAGKGNGLSKVFPLTKSTDKKKSTISRKPRKVILH